MYLICYVTSQDHFIEASLKFMDGSFWCYITPMTSKSGDHRHCGNGDIIFLICRVISRGKFMGGNPSR